MFLRAGHGERLPGDGEELALVIDIANLVGVDEDIGLGVGAKCLWRDGAFEELVHDVHVLVGPVVALIVWDLAF